MVRIQMMNFIFTAALECSARKSKVVVHFFQLFRLHNAFRQVIEKLFWTLYKAVGI
jgi:hypothetical protein